MSSLTFRLAVIGAGRMGRTHLRALKASSAVSVTAIVEPVETSRGAIAGGDIRGFESLDALVAAGGIDGVLIAAPSDRHVELVRRAAAAGLPILCEKPCGTSSSDARLAAEAAGRYGVPLQVAYWRRYVPALQALKARIEEGELGDVHFVACYQWDGAPPGAAFRRHSGGIFIDMGVHEFDQIRWLTGQEFDSIEAVASPLIGDTEVTSDVDSAQALGELSGGASALVSLGRWYPGGDMARVEVFGTRDAVHAQFLDPSEGERIQLEALRRQAESFAAFASGGRPAGASVADAAATLEAAERASRAIPRLRGASETALP